ncbi:ubiquitin-protein ligase (E3) [Saitoella coloradoensis]
MFANFSGDTRRPRNVNLGGKKKEVNREALLKKAQEERRLREEERRRNAAASKIQGFLRRRREVQKMKEEERREWDRRIEEWAHGQGMVEVSEKSWGKLLDAVVALSLFCDVRQDTPRVLWLLDNLLQFDIKSGPQVSRACLILAVFGRILLSLLRQPFQGRRLESLRFLSRLPMASYKKLVLEGYYRELATYIITSHQYSVDALTAILAPLRVTDVDTMGRFVWQFLSVSHLQQHMGEQGYAQLKSNLKPFLVELFLGAQVVRDAGCAGSLGEEWVLAHLIDIARSAKASEKLSGFSMAQYIKAISVLLRRLPPSLFNAANTDVAPPFVTDAIEHLSGKQHIQALLAHVSPDTTADLSGYFISLMKFWPSKEQEVLMQLSIASTSETGPSLVRMLWEDNVRKSGVCSCSKTECNARDIMAAGDDGEWDVLVLFLEVYSRVLLTMVDDEFLSTRNPISLTSIKEMVLILKNVAFAMYWYEMPDTILGSAGWTWEEVRGLVTKMLQQLHARDARRRFLVEGAWLMTERVDMGEFIKAVVEEDELTSSRENSDDEDDEEGERKKARPRQTFMTPRLNILRHCPFFIPFDVRVQIFREFVYLDRKKVGLLDNYFHPHRQKADIRRDRVFEDAFNQIGSLGPRLKGPLSVTFFDSYGMAEAGIDGGGVTKEFLTAVCRQAFDANYGLFKETKENLLYPNPHAFSREKTQLAYYEFLGKIIGKCLYEGILVDVAFAPFFLLKLVGRSSYLDDLPGLDPELYQGLIFLKQYTGDVEGDLALNFTVTNNDMGAAKQVELLPGGADIAVTRANRLQYIYLVSNYRLNTQLAHQSRAFVRGLSEMADKKWLAMFDQAELQTLIGGAPVPINVADLKRNTDYGGYLEKDDTIKYFWEVMEEFADSDRRGLVKFVTSVARPPLLGFKELNPKFGIRDAGGDESRLPTASTCVNLLKLPRYKSKETLKQKMLYAIRSGAGFDLS